VSSGKSLRLLASTEVAGLRLDQAISRLAAGVSRAEARRLIDRGSVFLGGARTKVASRVVKEGQRIDVHLPPATTQERAPLSVPDIPILLLTPDLVVVDKPSGLLSAPTPQTDQADLLYFLQKTLGPLHLVHRLDAHTSGAMVVARNAASARTLSAQLESRTLGRTYVALLSGEVASDFRADSPIDGRDARTHFRVLALGHGATQVEVQLETGRTHQIRIHARAAGHPVLGDRKYGGTGPLAGPKAPRLALHAAEVRFVDPASGRTETVQAPFPPELAAYWATMC
jgi:23S rRNA pseudouridine1911/1915/1917 synthase